jgi:hypothetical protein
MAIVVDTSTKRTVLHSNWTIKDIGMDDGSDGATVLLGVERFHRARNDRAREQVMAARQDTSGSGGLSEPGVVALTGSP